MKTQSVSAVLLVSTLLACKLFQPSPEKVCAQKEKLGGPPKAACVQQMSALKRDEPKTYACLSKCVMKAKSESDVNECSTDECPTSNASGSTASADSETSNDDVATFVDELSSYSIKSRLEREYQYYGYELLKESNNDAGWAGSIRLGKPGSEAQIYRVILGDASSNKEASSLARGLFNAESDKIAHWKAGEKKFVFIECLAAMDATVGKRPGKCYSGDRSDDMLTALAKPY